MGAPFLWREGDRQEHRPPILLDADVGARPLEQEYRLAIGPGAADSAERAKLLVVAGVRCCGQENHSAAALRDGIHRRASRAPEGRRMASSTTSRSHPLSSSGRRTSGRRMNSKEQM